MILYGAGGHAKVIYDRLQIAGIKVLCLFDDNADIKSFMNQVDVQVYNPKKNPGEPLLIAIGSNAVRQELSEKIYHTFGVFIDSTSVVSKSSIIGAGSMVMTNSVVHADAIIGAHTIINTGAIIEHDARIGDFAHVGPGAVICGAAELGKGVLIGANATVLPGVKIGDWAVVGAGSVVTKNVAARTTVAGSPAK